MKRIIGFILMALLLSLGQRGQCASDVLMEMLPDESLLYLGSATYQREQIPIAQNLILVTARLELSEQGKKTAIKWARENGRYDDRWENVSSISTRWRFNISEKLVQADRSVYFGGRSVDGERDILYDGHDQEYAPIEAGSVMARIYEFVVAEKRAVQLIDLSGIEEEKWNLFLSNFSEVRLKPFKRDGISEQELIRFGILHTWLNERSLISRNNEADIVAAETVEKAVEKYFGRTIANHASALPGNEYAYEYESGRYSRSPSFLPEFLGQRFAVKQYFTQVTRLIDEGAGCYTVYGSIYYVEPQTVELHSLHRPLEQWDVRMKEAVHLVGAMDGVFKQIAGNDGSRRYILQEYNAWSLPGK